MNRLVLNVIAVEFERLQANFASVYFFRDGIWISHYSRIFLTMEFRCIIFDVARFFVRVCFLIIVSRSVIVTLRNVDVNTGHSVGFIAFGMAFDYR